MGGVGRRKNFDLQLKQSQNVSEKQSTPTSTCYHFSSQILCYTRDTIFPPATLSAHLRKPTRLSLLKSLLGDNPIGNRQMDSFQQCSAD